MDHCVWLEERLIVSYYVEDDLLFLLFLLICY